MTDAAGWMRVALERGTVACALWKGIRNTSGDLVDLELLECDEGYARWSASTQAEMVGKRYTELVPSGVSDRLDFYLQCMASGEPKSMVFRPLPLPQRAEWAEIRLVPCGLDLLYIQTFDVTERERTTQRAMDAAENAEAQLSRMFAAVNASPDAFAVYWAERDASQMVQDIRILFVNDAAAAPTTRPSEFWQGSRLVDFFPEAVESGLYDRVVDVLNRHEAARLILKTDSTHGWHGAFENVITPFGPDLALITWKPEEAAAAVALAAPPAGRDSLTGVLSRSGFMQELDRRIAAGTAADCALQVVDLDNFGGVNDVLGRHAADNVLARFAAEASLITPRPVLVGRTGPDEFAMLFAADVTANLQSRFQRQLVLLSQIAKANDLPRLLASGGYVELKPSALAEDALRDCDTALRSAIAGGGGRNRKFTPELRDLMMQRANLADGILRGLNRDEFRVAYQPIVRLDDQTVWGAEALVRWQHPERGLLLPGAFIAAAETSGLIVELGAWVMETGIAHLASHPELPHLSINVASRQLQQDDIPALVARSIESHGVQASRVVIEITESAMLPDSLRVKDQIYRLRQLGVQVALDDFGSGYSSVAYLDRLPVDVVKLDAYFLDGELNERRRRLVQSTASMVRSLGAAALIEHVETLEQLALARDAGVELGQGYLFGTPEIPVV